MARGVSAARCGKLRREEAGKSIDAPLGSGNGGNALPHFVSNLRQTYGKVRQQVGLCRTYRGTPKGVSPDRKCGTPQVQLQRCGT